MKRVRTVLVWVFSVLIGLVMLSQGLPKFLDDGRWTGAFAEWGYPSWFRILIGVLEVGGAVTLVVPRVAHYAASMLATIMLGAIGTLILHARGADAITPLVYATLLAWIAWERWPRAAARAPTRA